MTGKSIAAVVGSLVLWPAVSALPAPGGSSQAASTQPTTTTTTAPAEAGGPSAAGAGPVLGAGRLELPASRDDGTTGLLYRMLAYTAVILLLGGVALLVVRKVLPKITRPGGKRISVVETVYLGPRKTVHLLQVGSQRFLVAGSRDGISMLGEVTVAFEAGQAGAAAPAEGVTFASALTGADAAAQPDQP